MYCCKNCFHHSFLKDVIEKTALSTGTCSFCATTSEKIVEASELAEYFDPLVNLYEQSTDGILLSEVLHRDWFIFNSEKSPSLRGVLLSKILGNDAFESLIVKSKFDNDSSYIERWERFKIELQETNRFFPKEAIDPDRFKELFDYLIMSEDKPKTWYRCRKSEDKIPYPIDKMGKPPKDKAPDGRANPKGISYFYGASNVLTAISETRPYKSELLSVGEFILSEKAMMIDLRDPKRTISPFGFDEDGLQSLFTQFMPFLNHLSASLSIPVLPTKKDFEYLPTQYLCEMIKDYGFHGIVFKSSLGDGDNIVMFDDSLLTGKSVVMYRNNNITIDPVKL